MDLDGCPSLEEQPLSLDEWKVLARWMQHYQAHCVKLSAAGDQGLTRAVRRAYFAFDQAVAMALSREPSLSIEAARKRCGNVLARSQTTFGGLFCLSAQVVDPSGDPNPTP